MSQLLEDAQKALSLARELGADNASASVSNGRSTQYRHRDGELEEVRESTSRSLSVELYVDGRYSSHATSDLRPEALRGFLTDAVALTRALEPDPNRLLPDPALYEGRAQVDLEQVDANLVGLERDRCLPWLASMDEAAHGDGVISATAHLSFGHGKSAHATTNGFEGEDESTGLTFFAETTLADGAKRPEAYAYAAALHLEDLPDPEAIGREALRRARARLGSKTGESGEVSLVVDREAAARLLGRVFGVLGAGSIQQKRSFLAEALNERIASPLLSVTDDPLVRRGLGSRLYDGEGIAAKKRSVIDKGVLKLFFVDTYYGRKLGWDPTTGGASNLVFELGSGDVDALARQVEDGVLVTGWNGGNADPTTGDFSFGMQGHRIEGGEVGEPLSEMNVTGNYRELLEKLSTLGDDPYPWSSMRVPSLVFERVQVSGT